jgi:hypothetical protein
VTTADSFPYGQFAAASIYGPEIARRTRIPGAGMIGASENAPPGMVAAAEQDFAEFRDRVSVASRCAWILLGQEVPELDVFAEVYTMLTRTAGAQHAAAMAAAAIVQLANIERTRGRMVSEPGS